MHTSNIKVFWYLFFVLSWVGVSTRLIGQPTEKPSDKKALFGFDSTLSLKDVIIATLPDKAEIYLDGRFAGFSPIKTTINHGDYHLMMKRIGYATEEISRSTDITSSDGETISLTLKRLYPLQIKSEKKGLDIALEGLGNLRNVIIDTGMNAPAEVLLPYGRYKIELSRNEHISYHGKIVHSQKRSKLLKLPYYSRSSIQLLTANYVGKNSFEASLGRIVALPTTGLSTSLLSVQYHEFKIEGAEGNIRNYRSFMPTVMLLNWDWRIGGAVHRKLDICALGRVKWIPGLMLIDKHVNDFYDATMWIYFMGVELSSRISFLNVNVRAGHTVYDGGINLWNKELNAYEPDDINVLSVGTFVSVGITLNGKAGSANNILRLWHKPLLNQMRDGF